MSTPAAAIDKPEAYGESGLNPLDRLGVWARTRPVRAYVKRERPGRVLDIGCGYDAGLIRALHDDVGAAVGIDLRVAPSAKALPRATFVEQPIEAALDGLPERSFDAVFMMSVLEHLPDGSAALAGCHRVLRPGGSLFVHVPTWRGRVVLEHLAFRHGLATDSIDDHRMYYDTRDLWPALVRAGFKPKDLRLRYGTAGCTLLAVAKRRA